MNKLRSCDLNWVLRGLPKDILDLLKRHPEVMLAGGFIRSRIANERVNDIDLFGPSKEALARICGELNPKQATREVETKNATTICRHPAIQVIHRWTYSTMEDLCASFDFTIARAVVRWDEPAKRFDSCIDDEFYADLACRRLNYRNPVREEDAGGSMLRVLKFYQRGYRIDLRSLADVTHRLSSAVKESIVGKQDPQRVLLALLHEVDPLVDLTHAAHLPSDAVDGDDDPVAADG